MKKTIRDVAAAAGVSPSTVSRVLNKSGYVSERSHARVMQAIQKMGYSPSALAVSFSRQQSNIIGVIVPDIYGDFFGSMVYQIEKIAEQQGYRILLCNSIYSSERERVAIEDLMSYKAAGLVLVPTPDSGNVEMLNRLIENGTPVICVDTELAGFSGDGIYIDNGPGVRELMETLVGEGYRRFAVLREDTQSLKRPIVQRWTDNRLQAIRLVLAEHGLPLPEDRVLQIPVRGSSRTILREMLLSRPDRPDAVISLSGEALVSAVCGLLACGVRIPDDIFVVGFDDQQVLETFGYSMVTSPKAADLGVVAAQALLNRLNPLQSRVPSQRIVLPTSMRIFRG